SASPTSWRRRRRSARSADGLNVCRENTARDAPRRFLVCGRNFDRCARGGSSVSVDVARESALARVAALAIWPRRVAPVPLAGGITNQNFKVEDRGRRYVVRVGDDILVHGVVRATELAASRAAYFTGLSPAVVHAEPGILVLDFIEGRTFTPEDVRNPANLERLVDMVRRCHHDIPQYLRGPATMFWVFHVLRDYGHTLREGSSRYVVQLPDLLARAARLEVAV